MNTHIVISRDAFEDRLLEAYDNGYSHYRHKAIAETYPSGWLPISSAPKDGTWVLVAGPSGYTTTPWHMEVCRYYPEYRPNNPWQNHADNAFADGGAQPTHFCPLVTPE